MSSPPEASSSQTTFFADSGTADHSPSYTEICNALYERELHVLSHTTTKQISALQLRLQALPHRVQRAAHYLARNPTPLQVDSHNGSWSYKQASQCPAKKWNIDTNTQWFSQHAGYGLPVPVYLAHFGEEHIELDSIDKVQFDNETLHLNKYGWFTFDGVSLSADDKTQLTLIKPTKVIMAAACCGHRWNHKGKLSPRSLTLRELLLSTTINWKKFVLPSVKSQSA
ncbi:hypothetical protein [Aestuariibacter sp. A3R04]|uniref:hypothetical protein n=1 Tax=Aestuariibacter sp. A3R04 TaxID=2841571 RepID=UPI001C081E0A|nr:hypothetical protein [Aestuariibacter sp. A3R04]MBU3022071.1 hypothetical protein [Aestuariibacter sp. A3R04]